LDYLRGVVNRKRALARQRLEYLSKGNYHGVSTNWLAKQTDGLFQNVAEFVTSPKCPVRVLTEDIAIGRDLFSSVVKEKSETNFGNNFDCEIGLASFLYAYVILNMPAVIVETGVANGITTNVLMKALEKTGGSLYSFDVDPRTENVYSGQGNWHFRLLKDNFEKDLKNQVTEIGKVDLWIHDSNHGYKWQAFEYELASRHLVSDGILVSDDIDASTAWGVSANSDFKKSFGVFDKRKFFGVATI
jgi:predicted O-methyltransferase YrrM